MIEPERKNPPRWFGPAIWGGMLLAVGALTAVATVIYEPTQQVIRVGEQTYRLPPEEVSSLRHALQLFVRIRPRNRPFEIVYDARSSNRLDPVGVPRIFSVSDHGAEGIWYSRHGRSLVVCRRVTNRTGGCGTWISYGGARWSILFPESHRASADALTREAVAFLRKSDAKATRLIG